MSNKEKILKNIKTFTIEDVKKESDNYFKTDLKLKSRLQFLVDSRCFYYKFCRTYFYEKSLNEIGLLVGCHHATVIHGLRKFQDLYDYNKDYKDNYDRYEDYLIKHFDLLKDLPEKIIDINKQWIQSKRLVSFYKNKYKSSQNKLNIEKTKLKNYKNYVEKT